MPMFRKKPVVVEAMLYTSELMNAGDIMRWAHAGGHPAMNAIILDFHSHLSVRTPEGTMVASPGDWIIKGVKGEFYPCKADIFAATYEPAAEQAQQDLQAIRDAALDEAANHCESRAGLRGTGAWYALVAVADEIRGMKSNPAQQDADKVDALLAAGAALSNAAFNLAQLEGKMLTADWCLSLDSARKAWDAARAQQGGQP